VAENFGVSDNAWKQIMFIVFKAINIFWRKCFVTNEHHTLKVCFFHTLSRHELHISGQSKVIRLNTAETCRGINGVSEVSTSEAIEDFNLFTIFTQMQQIILKINTQNLTEQSSGDL